MDELDLYQEVRDARAILRALPLLESIKLAFNSEVSALDLFLFIRETLGRRDRRHIHNWSLRSRFVYWVYREKELAKSIAYIRPATLSKHRVVRALIKPLKKKGLPVSSKVIHAWAFRPRHFEKHAQFQPMYRRVVIAKGRRGWRYLDVPFRNLALLQRRILDFLLNPLCEQLLSPSVFGFCTGPGRTIFHGVHAHSKARFVVGLDIENFFPSVKFEMVASTLKNLPPESLGNLGFSPEVRWEWDLVLLLSKLVTYRGRLPQGAPTSPAVANLVFHDFDKQILAALGEHFSYSRYADDLTFSISATKAKKMGIKNRWDAQRYVERTLTRILSGKFRLNSKKTRCADLREGARITGLFLDQDSVRLPRSKSRSLRTTLYKVAKLGLLETARNHPDFEPVSEWQSVSRRRGERFLEPSSRVSAERLCALAASRICTGLILTDLRRHDDNSPLIGSRLRDTLERVYSRAWRDEIVARQEDRTTVLVTYLDGTPALRLMAQNGIGFLTLGRDDATCCAKLVNRLVGYRSFLNAAPRNRIFQPLLEHQEQLEEVLQNLWVAEVVVAPQPKEVPATIDPRPSLSIEDDILRLANEVLGRACVIRSAAGLPEPGSVLEGLFRTPAYTPSGLNEWMAAANQLLSVGLPQLPIIEKDLRDPFSFIRVHVDQVNGNRGDGYNIEAFYYTRRLRKPLTRDDHILQLQEELLQDLSDLLGSGSRLKPNPWAGQGIQRERLIRELETLRRDLTSSGHDRRIFAEFNDPERNASVRQHLDNLARPFGQADNTWLELFSFGESLIKSFKECMETDGAKGYSDTVRTYWRGAEGSFRMAALLRNRAAHTWSPTEENIENSRQLELFVRRALGLTPSSSPQPEIPGDLWSYFTLKLTPFEANEVAIRILDRLLRDLQAVKTMLLPDASC